MEGIFAPANIVVFVIVALGLFFGIRRMVGGLTRGQSCCSDGADGRKVKKVRVTDTNEANYPYTADFPIGGMSCSGCAENVTNALNGVEGTWATVDLASGMARVRAKRPIDESVYESAVRQAGYFIRKL